MPSDVHGLADAEAIRRSVGRRIENRTLLLSKTHPAYLSLSQLLSSRRKIGYVGFLCERNVGDIVLYEVCRAGCACDLLFRMYPRIPLEAVAARALTPSAFGRGFILGGGTLIGSANYLAVVERALDGGAKFASFGTGILDKGEVGVLPQQRELKRRWSRVLSACSALSVRGPVSKRRLEEYYGVAGATELGDPALDVAAIYPSLDTSPGLVGVNLGSHYNGTHDKAMFSGLVRLVKRLFSDGYSVMGFAFHPLDVTALAPLSAATGVSIHIEHVYTDVAKVSLVSQCEFVVAQRLHMSVLAHAYDVPAIGLEYRSKLRDHFWNMGQDAWLVRSGQHIEEEVVERADHLLSVRGNVSTSLRNVRLTRVAGQRDFIAKASALLS